MSAPMTPERLAEIRAWLAWEYRASFGERGEQIAAELLAEVERLTGLLDSVRTWATEHYDPLAHEGADTSELIEILDDAELIETPEQSAALVDTVPDHLTGDLK